MEFEAFSLASPSGRKADHSAIVPDSLGNCRGRTRRVFKVFFALIALRQYHTLFQTPRAPSATAEAGLEGHANPGFWGPDCDGRSGTARVTLRPALQDVLTQLLHRLNFLDPPPTLY